jgi:hypothetical protein
VKILKLNITIKRIMLIFIQLSVLSIGAITVSSKAQELLIIRMEPSTYEVTSIGEVFNITIYIENIPEDPGLIGVQFKISWDPAILNAVNMTEILFHSVTPPEEQDNIWKLKHTVAAGYVEYAYTWMDLNRAIQNGYAPISGNKTVATITFNATSVGYTVQHFDLLKIGGIGGIRLIDTYYDSETQSYPKGNSILDFNIIENSVTVGNPPPQIVVISPKNMTYSKIPIDLIFTINKPTSWMCYSLDGQANVTSNGNTTISPPEGQHNIIVYANDTTGNMGSSNMVYFLLDTTPPIASFSYSPSPPNATTRFGTYKWEITFNASSSRDLLTNIVSYVWNFGDGYNGTGIIITHIYRQPGIYNATLTVTDAANNSNVASVTLTLTEPPPSFGDLPWWWITTITAIPVAWGIAIVIYLKKTKKTSR